MARHRFGGVADYVIAIGDGDAAVLQPGATVSCWNVASGGAQHTDLMLTDGVTPITGGTLTADSAGAVPEFLGPDGVRSIYFDANGGAGPRRRALATNIGEDLTAVEGTVSSTTSLVESHLSAGNPHFMALDSLSDVDTADQADGTALVYNGTTETWTAVTLSGVSNTVSTDTDQMITATKTWDTDDPAKSAIVLQAATGQTADMLVNFHSTGQRTGYFNEKGELRAIAAATDSVPVRFKGVSGQTAHIMEITDISNNPLAWYEPDGRARGPNQGYVFPFSMAGAVSIGSGQHRIYNDTGVELTIRAIRASAGTAPTGASLIVDVNKGGSTIFSTQANRPTIAASANTSGKVTAINTTTWGDGEYLTIDIDQVGSTVAGSNLTVTVWAY